MTSNNEFAELSELFGRSVATVDALLTQRSAESRALAEVFRAAAGVASERAERAAAKVAAAVEFPRVVAKLDRGAIAELSGREARAAVRRFLELRPDHLLPLLRERPMLFGIFARQLFAEWDRGSALPRWKGDVALVAQFEQPLPVRVPIQATELLAPSGPEQVARFLKANALSDVFDELQTRFGLSGRWGFTHHTLLRWLIATSHSRDTTAHRIRELTRWRHRGLLLPLRRQAGELNGSDATRSTAVASILARCRDFSVDVPPMLEELLISSTFGDPRSVLSKEWEEVQSRSRGGFDAFVQGLIREDLDFFFSHAMHEAERATFWLRYLPSIRRTICILDATSLERVRTISKGLNDKARSAASRALRMNDPMTSAFCLVFDHYVAVEFSQTGNATYIYGRDDFEQKVLPATLRRPSVTDLKKPFHRERLIHSRRWQYEFQRVLSSHSIEPTN